MKIKTVLVLLFALFLACSETQAQSRFYSRSGVYSGRTSSVGSSTRFYSSAGRYCGRAATRGSTTRFYGSSGKYSGTIRTGTKK